MKNAPVICAQFLARVLSTDGQRLRGYYLGRFFTGFQMEQELLKEAEAIADDDVSGATELSIRAADLLLKALEQGLEEHVASVLKRGKPMMAPILNLAMVATSKGPSAMNEIKYYREGLLQATKRAAQNCANFIASKRVDPSVVLTISASAVVEQSIIELFHIQRLSLVVVGESRPRLEGQAMAQRLAQLNVPVAVTYDAALPALCTKQSLVLLGADAVLPDCFVNKAGSLALCLAARSALALSLVVTTTHKVLLPEAIPAFSVPEPKETFSDEGKLRFLDHQFDRVSLNLVDCLVTETFMKPQSL